MPARTRDQMIDPVLDFHRDSGRLVEAAAEGPVREVSKRVIEAAAIQLR